MTTTVQVVACHSGASVQDLGRTGLRRFGVSTAGAMDQGALMRANLLVGNDPGAAGIELALAEARFRVSGGALSLAVAGPGAQLVLGDRPQDPDASAIALDGDMVRVVPGRSGNYAYLAVSGGITTPVVLGSRALHLRSGIGGLQLGPGDILPCGSAEVRPQRRLPPEPSGHRTRFRIVLGPQADSFGPETLAAFLAASWHVQPRFDRMGLRLAGPPVPAFGGHDIVSDGVVPGSIQIPGDGQPLVLLRDCQTTGGYPKIATVISADLDALVQCQPGTVIRFSVVDADEACIAARHRDERLRSWQALALSGPAVVDASLLLSTNLIGGVTDGSDCAGGRVPG